MHTFKLKILTPDTKLFDGEVESFTVPTQSGEITILKNHAPLITLISIGEIKVKTKSGEEKFLVQGGVIDVKSTSPEFEVGISQIRSLTQTKRIILMLQEIERAKEAMKVNAEDIDFALEESIIERNLFLKRMKK